MSEQTDKSSFNPFGPFIRLTGASIDAWGDLLSRTMGNGTFARAVGQQMDFYLEATRLMREQTRTVVEFTMQQAGLPISEQVEEVAERLTHLEMRMDDLDAKLDDVLDLLKTMQAPQESKPEHDVE